ncbi:hypothetical protein [Acidomonas methanolica]|uniref:Uncharacterized protein n=1 Tax=Acidomonas methanolica NBRC 104435 TaxID=1231351 RepID=A0A023D767_ACIMT|nr:hypothetical protein [Acidomonas methanolica]MBU2654658.1 hypothetical protein [Acidomonas methanolica]TCS27341.1 hypothetical protein EDC31_11161 [Acidomonas methanolica]GAJ29993.1 hypothetical protein Amme_093_017 [Acidomonas methanolica NBRC 104435]GBQ48998.1 hypothetical protein AA0498_0879 [Acidomonas methanolica]GEK99633.1 hypothetical protein AME01nite_21320 [Acidomonas methanolica NBRC 104435]
MSDLHSPPLSRRSLFAAAGALALGGCSVTSGGGLITVTLEVRVFAADATMALDVVRTILGFSALPAALVTATSRGIALIQQGLADFTAYAGDEASLSFATSNVPAAITSVITDIRAVASDIAATLDNTALAATLAAQIRLVASDVAQVATILGDLVSAAMGAPGDAQSRIAAIKARHGLI